MVRYFDCGNLEVCFGKGLFQTDTAKKYRAWIFSTLALALVSFILFASFTVYIDPYFHYHAPLDEYEYPIDNERYQNDGITRNFEYNGIITGTSMTQNFKTSEADELFQASFIKVPFSGACYKEINDNLKRAYGAGKKVDYVIRCLDYDRLILDKDAYKEGADFPTYLYNDNPFDDLNYVLNKSILFTQTWGVVKYTEAGNKTTTFDEYSNWMEGRKFGTEAVLRTYKLGERAKSPRKLTEEERGLVIANIRQNVTDLANAHPETTFYLFLSPFSICYWDTLENKGLVDQHIDAEQAAIEELLKCPNIRLYSFSNNFELVCNLDHYKDTAHYGEWVNSQMLQWMHDGEYQLTLENYEDYIETIRSFYNGYDYSSLRK